MTAAILVMMIMSISQVIVIIRRLRAKFVKVTAEDLVDGRVAISHS